MKRVIITKIYSCYSCPNYERDDKLKRDMCYIKGEIKIVPDKDGDIISKDCPLKEDK